MHFSSPVGAACARIGSVPQRSRSHLEVNGQNWLKFSLSRPLLWVFSMNLKLFHICIPHHQSVRHAQESGLYLKGQGHTWRSKVKICLNSACPDHYSDISQWNLKLFHICIHLHQLVWHVQDQGLYLIFWESSISHLRTFTAALLKKTLGICKHSAFAHLWQMCVLLLSKVLFYFHLKQMCQ